MISLEFSNCLPFKQNQPWRDTFALLWVAKKISFKLSILLPPFNSCLALIILLYGCFSFSFIMSGRGRGKGRGRRHPTSSKPVLVCSKPRKGRKLNEWNTKNMKNALAEFDREMQVISLLHQLL